MTNQTNRSIEPIQNIPALRFPEFNGDWELKKLGDVAEISSGGTPSRTNQNYWNGNIPWVSTTLIDFNFIDKTEEYITQEGLKNSSAKLFPVGTLLMAMYGQGKTRGKIAVLNIEAATNQACGAIITNSNRLNSLFAFQNLSKRYDEIRDLSNQGGQENLSGGILKGIEISFPTLPEQTKIATFLTAVDEKLQALKQKKTLLEHYKKGVMQKIFSQELRFKDDTGNEYPDWEEKKLGEICEIAKSGGTPTSTKREYYDGDIPFLSISDMTSQGKYLNYTSNHISELGLVNSSSWIVPANSIIYSMYASVGFVAINNIPLATSQAVLNLILKNSVNTDYIYYTLVDFQKKITQFITTGTQGNLNAQSVKGFILAIPSLSEQTKIANFLSAIDDKINHCQVQIEKMEVWKKGLLQKMFV
jgi:type I restriction enzyme S subunit